MAHGTNRLYLGTGELHPPAHPRGQYLFLLTLAALGVVYGDLGTSPLYAMRETFLPGHGLAVTGENVLGVLSLIIWSLILVVSVKYLTCVLRADNQGEGGILALMSLVVPRSGPRTGRYRTLLLLGLFGTALVYGDGMITPAISVLSAVEGLEVATPLFAPYVEPITIAVLVALFLFQKHGTGRVGKVFGPIMVVWFGTLAVLGLGNAVQTPAVFGAFNPVHAWRFFAGNGWWAFFALGAVFLALTGAEALYADMGHFGPRPIRVAWFALVLPALILNYLGQGALLLHDPAAVANPFYLMAPGWALYPLVAISTMATVIASQALISGAFSLTMQAVQLGYVPRSRILHTSATEIGQIYIPDINTALMLSSIGLVLGFQSSSNLAAAYGFAVSTTMVTTTVLFFVAARERWQWSAPFATLVAGTFMVIDMAYFGANLLKIPHGGWFPLIIGVVLFTLLTTWKKGRRILAERISEQTVPRELFLQGLPLKPPLRVPGTAVFMFSDPAGTPPALIFNLKHNGVLHERVIFLSVRVRRIPYVPPTARAHVEPLGHGIFQVSLSYGFMESVNVPEALAAIDPGVLPLDVAKMTYFLGRETLLASHRPGMALWREKLFAMMTRNAGSAAAYFGLPPGQVVELGAQVEI